MKVDEEVDVLIHVFLTWALVSFKPLAPYPRGMSSSEYQRDIKHKFKTKVKREHEYAT
jgi:hypothetical protein